MAPLAQRIHHHILFVIALTCIGGFLHFYNLNWGAPFYFHPDERNIASSVSQLSFPEQMNPHFFAYGSLPIYTIYFTGYLMNFLSQFLQPTSSNLSFSTTFAQAIVISRFYSALFATLLIPLLFVIGRKLSRSFGHPSDTAGLFAAFLATFSTGLIQFAHFGTFELWLTFFTVLLFLACLQTLATKAPRDMLFLGILSGILVSTKISHMALLPIPIIVLFVVGWKKQHTQNVLKKIMRGIRRVILFFFLVSALYFATNPYVMLDTPAFLGSMRYESQVALGTLPVFYTGEFFDTLPILFPFMEVYPFLLNPLLTLLLIPAICSLVFFTIKQKNSAYLLLLTFYFFLFFSQTFLFVKWTRYMVPTLPFVYLIISFALWKISQIRNPLFGAIIHYSLFIILIVTSIIFSLSYFITAFVQDDTRIAAAEFARQTIPTTAPILSETYDLGITTFNNDFTAIHLFNTYELENTDPQFTLDALYASLARSDYLILPSQRVFATRRGNEGYFTKGASFYNALLTGNIGFVKVYETPCDIFCKITYLSNPIDRFEGTATVFDRPTVMIFKKL